MLVGVPSIVVDTVAVSEMLPDNDVTVWRGTVGMLTTMTLVGMPFTIVGTVAVIATPVPDGIVTVPRGMVGTLTTTTLVGMPLIVVGRVEVKPIVSEVKVMMLSGIEGSMT